MKFYHASAIISFFILACGSNINQPKVPRQIQCPDMGTCMMLASQYCGSHQEFTMVVQQGSKSGLTVAAWQPSPDGLFHLQISCP